MAVPILKQSHNLIASIQSALSDRDLLQLRDDLADLVGRHRARGVIVDVLCGAGEEQAGELRARAMPAESHRDVVAHELAAEIEIRRRELGARRKLGGQQRRVRPL